METVQKGDSMPVIRKIINVCLVCIVCSPCLWSAFSKDDAGTSAAQFLKLGAGARAAGMGETFAAVSDDSTAVYWNPAGLRQIKRKMFSFMHAVWFEDISYDWTSVAIPFQRGGVLGIGIQYTSYGSLKNTDESGIEHGSFHPNDTAANLAYAVSLGELAVGVTGKYISSKIKEKATAFAGDIGFMYKIMNKKISLGLVGQNIGSKMKYVDTEDPLPANIKLGAAYRVLRTMENNFLVSCDINAPVDNAPYYNAGIEYSQKVVNVLGFALRAGYSTQSKDVDGLKGLTGGLGLEYRNIVLDYAFAPFGDLGDTHRVSLGVKF
jgi:hypothetical protein